MSAAFTPAPWHTRGFGYEKYGIYDERGTDIGFVHRRQDARLIGAAPDMLAALEKLQRDYIHDGCIYGICQAALAKARGEA